MQMKKWYELAKARMKELDITQDQVAEQMGVTQGAVAHWLGGRREPSLEKISALLEYLGLSSMFRENGASPPEQRPVEANAEHLGDMAVWSDGDPLEEDECAIPYYAEVEFAGGDGMTVVMEVADRTLRFSNATLRAAGVECENAAVARIRGKSMEKLILNGAAIGFDRADTSVIDGEIYAFNHEGMLRVKYLYRLPGGAIRIRSENAEEFPDEIMSAEQYRHEIKMLGRVFWWSTVRRSPKKK